MSKTGLGVLCCLVLTARVCLADPGAEDIPPDRPVPPPLMTLAVLGFQAGEGVPEDIGRKIDALVFANLSSKPELQLVERERLDAVLGELELGLAGITSANEALQVGKLVGARVLVTGQVFSTNGDLIIVARIIGTETSRVFGEAVKVPSADEPTDATRELADMIAANIERNARAFSVVTPTQADRIEEIRSSIAKLRLPRVLVVVSERHRGRLTIDPAGETEVCFYLDRCGFSVVDKKKYAKWAREYAKDPETASLQGLGSEVDMVILGEAVSEVALRRGNLVAGKARIELRAIDARTGRILAVDRQTTAAVDLSEMIAAKTAVQEAAAEALARMIPEFVRKWNAPDKDKL